MEQKKFQHILGDGLHKGLSAFWMLSKIMIPVYVVMTILARTPALARVAETCAPLMKHWGLPGDAAMAIVLGMTINIYACIAATVALHLTPAQMTIVAVIIGISHNNILEGSILHKTGAPIGILIPLRIVAGLGLGWLVGVGFQFMS
jgi:Fe2+ transport system protein B